MEIFKSNDITHHNVWAKRIEMAKLGWRSDIKIDHYQKSLRISFHRNDWHSYKTTEIHFYHLTPFSENQNLDEFKTWINQKMLKVMEIATTAYRDYPTSIPCQIPGGIAVDEHSTKFNMVEQVKHYHPKESLEWDQTNIAKSCPDFEESLYCFYREKIVYDDQLTTDELRNGHFRYYVGVDDTIPREWIFNIRTHPDSWNGEKISATSNRKKSCLNLNLQDVADFMANEVSFYRKLKEDYQDTVPPDFLTLTQSFVKEENDLRIKNIMDLNRYVELYQNIDDLKKLFSEECPMIIERWIHRLEKTIQAKFLKDSFPIDRVEEDFNRLFQETIIQPNNLSIDDVYQVPPDSFMLMK